MHEVMISLDPSTVATGWAVWRGNKLQGSGVWKPSRWDVSGEWLDRSKWMVLRVIELVAVWSGDRGGGVKVVAELPEEWNGSARGDAARNGGALGKLQTLAGMILWAVEGENRGTWVGVTVRQWKGQVPKSVVQKRLEKRYGTKFLDDNESDAVGLGSWYIINS